MELLNKTEMIIGSREEEVCLVQNLQEQLKEYLLNNAKSAVVVTDQVRHSIEVAMSDQFRLLKFLRGRKNNLQKAFNSLIRYAQVSCELYPEMFAQEVVPDSVRMCFEKEIMSVFRHVDGQGRIILGFSAARWDEPSLISVHDIMTASRIIADALMDYHSSALFDNGLVIVVNADGVTMEQVRQYTIPVIIKFTAVFLQAYPIPIKQLYYVNMPFFAKSMYTILKPFLPKKLKERMVVSSGLSELHEQIPVSILPASLGGSLSEEEALLLSPTQHHFSCFFELPM